MNKIVTENAQPGSPASEWDYVGSLTDSSFEGFTTEISVNAGETVHFKITAPMSFSPSPLAYRLDIYRLGYYGGLGARKIETVNPTAPPQVQPPPIVDPASGLIDCGNWQVSASWPVPSAAVSGVYVARLVRADGVCGAHHVVFIVRDDAGGSDLLFQTSDTTWQAYNDWPGGAGARSLYTVPRPSKVSYNRPFRTRDYNNDKGANWLFNAEYPMIRWLEANGYDVSYCAGVDTERYGLGMLTQHKAFLSVGHDEYWSAAQRANVEAARDAGVHLAFFSGNEVFWKTRWEDSIDGSNTHYRTLVCYKETHANAKIDPTPVWTGTWRDPRFSPPSDGGRPENALAGTIFVGLGFTDNAITVSAEDGRLRFWRNTAVANLAPGQEISFTTGTLGYEWDTDLDNGSRPAGLIRLSSTGIQTDDKVLLWDFGSTYGPGAATHHLTLYRHKSGALVFGAGTVQWSWGLDNNHDSHDNNPGVPNQSMQQAMVNLFADMGVQPASLQTGLLAASASTDNTPPTSNIIFPKDGAMFQPGEPITILGAVTGTASDVGGVVGAVEVSVDGGLTWHPAVRRENWGYSWTATGNGLVTILSRAVDDSGNLESPSAGVDIVVGDGPGGPILLIVNGSYDKNPFGNYLGEILRAEGLVAFRKIELAMLMRKPDPLSFLNTFKLVLVAETMLLPDQRQLLRSYVSGGGNLIAIRPDRALADLFGLSFAGERPEVPGRPQFFAVDTASGPGVGIAAESLQYHGDADNYTIMGASALASLWDNIYTPSANPAVVLNNHGNGKAAAFTFDLAKSIVLMRQGNPHWKDSEGDGAQGVQNPEYPLAENPQPIAPEQYRPMDMFVRVNGGIWFEPSRLRIPQADEQQRLLANFILELLDAPTPRLWYLPGKHKSLIVNTGDGCFSSTNQKIDTLALASTFGTYTLYLTQEQIQNEISTAIEQDIRNSGHEIGVHVYDPSQLQTYDTLHQAYSEIISASQANYGHGSRSARNHTIDWVGWVDMAKIEAEHGTRLDLNYYHYWEFKAAERFARLKLPTDKTQAYGYFTGSGLPQRFCDEDGIILPIWQLLTEWVDEFFDDNKAAKVIGGFTETDVVQLVKNMLTSSENGYYSAFVTNIHPVRFRSMSGDITAQWALPVWQHAKAMGIPICSAEKFLDFVQARSAVTFHNLGWDGTQLRFDFGTSVGGQDLTLMVPDEGLASVYIDGAPVSFTTEMIKGRGYALFTTTATAAHIVVTYGGA